MRQTLAIFAFSACSYYASHLHNSIAAIFYTFFVLNVTNQTVNIFNLTIPGSDKPGWRSFVEFTLGDLNTPGSKMVDNLSWNIGKDFIGLGRKLQFNAGNGC